MPEKESEELLNQLANADSTELDDESLEDASGGNGNCNNVGCCATQQE